MGFRKSQRGNYLMSIDFNIAFDAYESVRHRLPRYEQTMAQPKTINTLDDVADDFDVFFLDAFGVLNIGEKVIPNVPERVASLQKLGKRVLVVSNAAGFPHATLVQKYKRLGYDFDPEDIITSRAALLKATVHLKDKHWGLMATRSTGLEDLEELRVSYIEEDSSIYDDVDGFLMLGSAAWTETRQALLEKSLRDKPRPVFVGNPDIVAPRESGFSTEPGYYAHRLADNVGVVPEFFGKPFKNIYELAFERIGKVEKSRILMVGDSLHTDILGANCIGIQSALVSNYGFFANQGLETALKTAQMFPDYILAQP